MIYRLRQILLRHLGLLGAFGYAGANFLLIFALQSTLLPVDFGIFALSQIFFYFGQSILNGLICSPLLVSLSKVDDLSVASSFFKVTIAYCATTALLFAVIFILYADSVFFGMLFGVFCLVSWLRWFLRSLALSRQNFIIPAFGDFAAATIVGFGAIFMLVFDRADRDFALILQLLGAIASLIFVGRGIVHLLDGLIYAPLEPFLKSMREHGRWSVIGVVSTELTANAHAYLVGFLIGPAAFAPIAAIALFFRPVTILAQALTQFERPRLAQHIMQLQQNRLEKDVRSISVAMLFTTVATVGIVGLLLSFFANLVGGGQFARDTILICATLISIGQVFFALSIGPSAALQSAGRFRSLAMISLIVAPVTVLCTFAIIFIVPGQLGWVLLGILTGEIFTCFLVHRRFASLLREGLP